MQCNRLSQRTDLEIKEELKKVDNLFLLHPETCFALVSCCLLYEYRGKQATTRGRWDIKLYKTITKFNCVAPSTSASVDDCCRVIHTGKRK